MDSSTQTLVGVALGAMLATLGGFLATQAASHLDQRRRQRSAALMAGEVLVGVHVILSIVDQRTRSVPPPFSPLVLNLIRSTQREIDVYHRNREQMFSIPDAELRARLHSFMVRLSVGLERISDLRSSPSVADPGVAADFREPDADDPVAFLNQIREHIPGLIDDLAIMACTRFSAYDIGATPQTTA